MVGRSQLHHLRHAALLLFLLGVMWSVPSSAAAVRVGVESDITWGSSEKEIDRAIALTTAAGIDTIRANVSWKGVEPTRGDLNTGWINRLDYAVNKARAAGLQVLMPITGGTPYWASADPDKYRDASGTEHWREYYRPSSNADFANYAAWIVDHFRGRVSHYQIWNEPNHPHFWPSGPDAGEYVRMLKPAYAAVKRTDPKATVVMAGISRNDYSFLNRLYRAGARPYFDVAAVHPYTGAVDPTLCWNEQGTNRNAKDAFCGIKEIRKTMVARGDADTPLWLTEFGYSVGTGPYQVSEAKQAEYLRKAYAKVESYPYVKRAYWYQFRNISWLHDDPTDYQAGLGLVETDFSAKPALGAMKDVTGASSR